MPNFFQTVLTKDKCWICEQFVNLRTTMFGSSSSKCFCVKWISYNGAMVHLHLGTLHNINSRWCVSFHDKILIPFATTCNICTTWLWKANICLIDSKTYTRTHQKVVPVLRCMSMRTGCKVRMLPDLHQMLFRYEQITMRHMTMA